MNLITKTMSKKIIYLLGIALTLILGAFLYQKYCCNCCTDTPKTDGAATVIEAPKANLDPFRIQGENFNYHCIDNIKFIKDDATAITPFADSVTIGFDKLKLDLASNPNEKMMITGYATSDEKNTTSFPNLALARANDIKKYFVANGFKSNQFELNGIIKDKWQMVSDTLIGPVSFEKMQIQGSETQASEMESLKETINTDPLEFYFNSNKSSDKLSAQEQKRVADIAKYIKNTPGAMISIVGHTDNVGTKESNIKLGQTRADFSKRQLMKNGLEASRIETSSQGSDDPIADNSTAEGRAKNRRTVTTIK